LRGLPNLGLSPYPSCSELEQAADAAGQNILVQF
jgi:hypothetical protein